VHPFVSEKKLSTCCLVHDKYDYMIAPEFSDSAPFFLMAISISEDVLDSRMCFGYFLSHSTINIIAEQPRLS